MGKKGKSFVFNCEWQEVLMEYPAEVRLEVYDAIVEYVASGKLSELKPLAKMAFSFIKKEIDYNQNRYEEIIAKRSEAGRAGANAANASKRQQKQQMPANAANASIYVNDNDKEKNSLTRVRKEEKEISFHPPSVEEVRAYVLEKGYQVDAEAFVGFYESKGWMVGKNKMKNWHAALVTWQKSREKERNGNFQRNADNRRGSLEVTATCAEDYKTTF